MFSHHAKIYSILSGGAGSVILAFLPSLTWAETANATWPRTVAEEYPVAELLQLVTGLGLVILAIVVFGYILRRMTGPPVQLGRQFRVISALSVGARERIILLQVGDQQLVVGVAPGRVQTLHVLTEPLATEDSSGGTTGRPENSVFAHKLQELLQRKPGR